VEGPEGGSRDLGAIALLQRVCARARMCACVCVFKDVW
jgi:hypothetical protein